MSAPETPARETVSAREVRPGAVLHREMGDTSAAYSEYAEVRYVEESDDGYRLLFVFAGGRTQWYIPADRVELVSPEEHAEFLAKAREQRKRAQVAHGLRVLADLVDEGFPLPWSLSVNGALSSVEDVHRVAEMVGADVELVQHSDERPATQVHHKLADGVELYVWHLGEKPKGDAE